VPVGTVSARLAAGRVTLAFDGHVESKALKAGRYATTLVATDAAGNRSAALTGPRFRIA
jgi:hypothetical protein